MLLIFYEKAQKILFVIPEKKKRKILFYSNEGKARVVEREQEVGIQAARLLAS